MSTFGNRQVKYSIYAGQAIYEVLSRLIYPDLYQRLFDQYSEA